jgi:hypothetical protein
MVLVSRKFTEGDIAMDTNAWDEEFCVAAQEKAIACSLL